MTISIPITERALLDTVSFGNYSLILDDGVLSFNKADMDAGWLTPYSFHSVLSVALRSEDTVDALTDFLLRNSFALDDNLVTDKELYSNDGPAQIADVLYRVFFPVYFELFPTEQWNDGFYGYFPITSDKAEVAVRSKTITEFTTNLFGVYRKDLVKLLANPMDTYVYAVMWSALFAEHVPADWVIEYMRTCERTINFGYSADVAEVNIFLKHFSKFEVRKFMQDDENCHLFAETTRIFAGLPESQQVVPDGKNRTDISFLHDHFTLISKNVEIDAKFTVPESVLKWDGNVVDNFTVNVLKSRDEFYVTGEVMNNCAGSVNYTVEAVEKRLVLIRFDTQVGEPYALMELKPTFSVTAGKQVWKIHQLFLANNVKVDETFEKLVQNFVTTNINGGK